MFCGLITLHGGSFLSLIIKELPRMCKFKVLSVLMAASASVMHGLDLCAHCSLSRTLPVNWSPCVSRINLAPPLTALQWHSFAPLRALPTPPSSSPRPTVLSPGPPSPPQQSLSLERASNSRV